MAAAISSPSATRSPTSRCTRHARRRGGRLRAEPDPAIRAWLERVAAQPGHVTIEANEIPKYMSDVQSKPAENRPAFASPLA